MPIEKGRIPILGKTIQQIPWNIRVKSFERIVCEKSSNADLVIMGFSLDKITDQKGDFFKMFAGVNDVLFVRAGQKIVINEE